LALLHGGVNLEVVEMDLLGLTELELWSSQESDFEFESNINRDYGHGFLLHINNLQKKRLMNRILI